jgi:hypothetical protein
MPLPTTSGSDSQSGDSVIDGCPIMSGHRAIMLSIGGRACLVWLVALCFGCSTPKPAISDSESFCDAFVNSSADQTTVCRGGSRSAYDLAIGALDLCRFVQIEVSSGAVTFHRDAAVACLDEMAALECWEYGSAATDCLKVYSGTIPQGGACYPGAPLSGEECIVGTRCVSDTQCPGTCVRYAQLSEACSTTFDASDYCAPGLFCDASSRCIASPAATPTPGSTCSFDDDCMSSAVSLACVSPQGPAEGSSGTCQPPSDTGPCLYSVDCRSGHCAGANPPTTTGLCTPIKVTDDSCTPGQNECGPGTYCGSTSTCTLLPSLGQSCAGNAGEGQACLDGPCDPTSLTCVPFAQQGDSCQQGFIVGTCSIELTCDAASQRCVPSCLRGNSCGAPGQACCGGGLCMGGVSCIAGQCSA